MVAAVVSLAAAAVCLTAGVALAAVAAVAFAASGASPAAYLVVAGTALVTFGAYGMAASDKRRARGLPCRHPKSVQKCRLATKVVMYANVTWHEVHGYPMALSGRSVT